jgi:hypothetical protein
LIVALLLASAALALVIALVGIDGAMYVGERSCGFVYESNKAKFHDRVAYFYALWGLPLACLLWAAAVLWVRPPFERSGDEVPEPTPSH